MSPIIFKLKWAFIFLYSIIFIYMNNKFVKSLISSSFSILPIIAIVFVLSLTNLAPIGNNFVQSTSDSSGYESYIFLGLGAVGMIIGLTLFQTGAAKGLTKVGEYMGASLSKQKQLFIVILFAFLLGALITCAEPSILITAKQIGGNKWVLIGSIAAGVGIFIVVGILRIIKQKSLKVWYAIFYLITFLLVCLLQVDPANHAFLPFIFDAGGITTGSATVPFILALGAGVATVRGGKNSRDSSFGLVGMASVGPIITMVILILCQRNGFSPYKVAEVSEHLQWWERLADSLSKSLLPSADFSSLGSLIEVLMALAPIIIIFFVYEFIYIKLPAQKVWMLLFGFFISFVGLVFFLTSVSAFMSPIGLKVGIALGVQENWIIILIAFALGLVTILCEPAVHVLTTQIEEISDGQLKRGTVLATLSIGVGVAIMLSMIRTLYQFSIMYYIITGYLLALVLMFFVPDIYTAIAFDSGGTASGPMAVSFMLPVIIGVYSNKTGLTEGVEFYQDCFGAVALIALTPILAIEVLGLAYQFKQIAALRIIREEISDSRSAEIIHFN